jgi:hypothetical protein
MLIDETIQYTLTLNRDELDTIKAALRHSIEDMEHHKVWFPNEIRTLLSQMNEV